MPRLPLPLQHALCGLTAALGLAGAALAENDKAALRTPLLPAYVQECSACHLAYPPGLLPAASWQRVASRLSQHYGTDASVDPGAAKAISAWLVANAGTSQRVGEPPPDDRITRSAWFVREHDEVPASTWKLPAVKSPAHCAACHTRAEQGSFGEREIRIPR